MMRAVLFHLCPLLCGLVFSLTAQQQPSWLPSTPMLDTERTWSLPSSVLLRFHVHDDGVYYIDADWLRSAGMEPSSIDPAWVKLFRLGKEVPLLRIGLEDGSIDETDAFIFVAGPPRNKTYRRIPADDEEYPEFMYRWSDSTAYCIVIDHRPAMPAPVMLSSAIAVDTLHSLYTSIHYEQDASLQYLGTNIDELNSFHWSYRKTWISVVLSRVRSWSFQVDLPAMDATLPSRITAKLAGYQGTPSLRPNHRVSLEIEGAGDGDSLAFNLGEQVLFTVDVPTTALSPGLRTITLHSRPREDERSAVAVDWVDIDVPAMLSAEHGRFFRRILSGRESSFTSLRIPGFESPDLLAFRVDADVVTMLPVQALSASDGKFAAVISDTIREFRQYHVVQRDAIPAAPRSERITPADIRTITQGAEAVIVTAKQLRGAAEEYRRFVQDEIGLSCILVFTDDIYNEFSFCMPEPLALRYFLYDAVTRWAVRPLSVLLLGDANANPRATSGAFRESLVPSLGWPASDAALASFDSLAVMQELAIGRIPARTGEDILSYLERHRQYRTADLDLWNKTTLHFSGGEYYENDTQLMFYRNINQGLIDALLHPPPFGGRGAHVYKTADPPSNSAPYGDEGVEELLRRGAMAISYVGHSATTTWDNGITNPQQLKADDSRGSVITDFGCSSARFAEAEVISFGEAAVLGISAPAMAYIGNSGFGARATGVTFPPLFYDELLHGEARSIGEALRRSRARLLATQGMLPAVRNAVTMSTLLGDPLLEVALPRLPDLVLTDHSISPLNELVTDAMDSLRLRVAVWNYGRAPSTSVSLRVMLLSGRDTLADLRQRIEIPSLLDTVPVALASPALQGEYTIIAIIDADEEVEEYREDNNRAEYHLTVLASNFTVINSNRGWTSASWKNIRLLNPLVSGEMMQSVRYEADSDIAFTNPRSYVGEYGSIVSHNADLATLAEQRAWFWRASGEPGGGQWTEVHRMRTNSGRGVVLDDSLDFVHADVQRLALSGGTVSVLPPLRRLRVSSGGAFAGATASVRIDGEEALPVRSFDGYAAVAIDSVTFRISETRIFNTMTSTAEADDFAAWLISRAPRELLVLAAAGDPTVNRDRFSWALRYIGSAQIDSVQERASFVCIGRAGAVQGSIPELRRDRFEGVAVIDTVYEALPPDGMLLSPWAGPASQWNTLQLDGARLDSGRADVVLFARRVDGSVDTILNADVIPRQSLTQVDAQDYPMLRAGVMVRPVEGRLSPELYSLRFDFVHAAELAFNEQSVFLATDSLSPGEQPRLHVGVINAGEGLASPSRLSLRVIPAGGSSVTDLEMPLPALHFMQRHDTILVLPPVARPGRWRLRLQLDDENDVIEQIEGNNTFLLPFVVLQDSSAPALRLLLDDTDVYDGDIVESEPVFVLMMTPANALPLTDPTRFTLRLNEQLIRHDDARLRFEAGSPAMPARLYFRPSLSDGKHVLEYNALDMLGNPAFESDRRISVQVIRDLHIRDLLCWPNPFGERTHFTFTLTGEHFSGSGRIDVYTVAGRRIRRLELPSGQLRVGFNSIEWDGRDQDGDEAANGVYFFKLHIEAEGASTEQIGRALRSR